ncbi:hypothetical protein BOX15_Mlig015747g2 [Macrostomum lignano]|uniref:WSC domain-containing protein n=1 Tax=Macrostomum lignano TaxID=282301 RepID=A0A267ED80_9PLAT|nr:hypothetical protein BOX15_Mlig015747g2 [Macrostomum lignano]
MSSSIRSELVLSIVFVCLTVQISIAASASEQPKKDMFDELTFSGCYTDTAQRPTIEGRKEINAKGMSRTKCLNACAKRGYKLFGLKSGSECYCGNNLMHSSLADAGKCSLPCPGDKSQQCGGKSEMSIYKINDVTFFDKLTTEVTAAAFYGCYKDDDNKQSVLLDVIEKKDNALSSEICRRFCSQKQMKFYGMKAGNLCYCGSALRKQAATEDGMCGLLCLGNRAETCGGKKHTEIYQILRIGNFQLPKPPHLTDEL